MKRRFEDFTLDERYCADRSVCKYSYPIDSSRVSIDMYQVCDGNTDCLLAEDELEGEIICKLYCIPQVMNLAHSLQCEPIKVEFYA